MAATNQLSRYESKVYNKGKTTLPLEIRTKLGINDNDTIIYIQEGNSFRITTTKLLLEQMRTKLQAADNKYTTDDFIAELRQESLTEIRD